MQTKIYLVTVRDRRYGCLAELLGEDGKDVRTFGDTPAYGIRNVTDLKSLAEPVRLILPFNFDCAEQTDALLNIPEGSVVFGGKLCVFAERLTKERRLTYHNLLLDREYNEKGALATAEGALAEAILHTPAVIDGSEVLIIGFGAVAHACASLFAAVGAKITIAARKASARAEAESLGYTPVSLPLSGFLHYKLIINTVPSPEVLPPEILEKLVGSPVIIELASGIGNIDSDVCASLGHMLIRLPGLPGKTSPESAAVYIRDAVYRAESDTDGFES